MCTHYSEYREQRVSLSRQCFIRHIPTLVRVLCARDQIAVLVPDSVHLLDRVNYASDLPRARRGPWTLPRAATSFVSIFRSFSTSRLVWISRGIHGESSIGHDSHPAVNKTARLFRGRFYTGREKTRRRIRKWRRGSREFDELDEGRALRDFKTVASNEFQRFE